LHAREPKRGIALVETRRSLAMVNTFEPLSEKEKERLNGQLPDQYLKRD
jgi:hypothetical protein